MSSGLSSKRVSHMRVTRIAAAVGVLAAALAACSPSSDSDAQDSLLEALEHPGETAVALAEATTGETHDPEEIPDEVIDVILGDWEGFSDEDKIDLADWLCGSVAPYSAPEDWALALADGDEGFPGALRGDTWRMPQIFGAVILTEYCPAEEQNAMVRSVVFYLDLIGARVNAEE